MLEDALVACPYCWEQIALDIDLSGGDADYTEDCPVCCQPIAVRLRIDQDENRWQIEVRAENE